MHPFLWDIVAPPPSPAPYPCPVSKGMHGQWPKDEGKQHVSTHSPDPGTPPLACPPYFPLPVRSKHNAPSRTPMLTIAGSKMATRVAPSLLKAAGVDELIVDSLEAYEETAVALATDPERLFKVRVTPNEKTYDLWLKNMTILEIFVNWHCVAFF